jgi:hypothetical protein
VTVVVASLVVQTIALVVELNLLVVTADGFRG